jgi:predicted acylesterase/phospholipase RssA
MTYAKIEHLVLAGGGSTGFITYGVLRELAKQKFWIKNDIKTMFCTSAGAFVGVIISLDFEWQILDNYLINRPWEKLVSFEPENLFSAYKRKGLLNINFITEAVKPLLQAKDIPLTVTLQEFYEIVNIELHMYTIDLNEDIFKTIDISYKTHPNMKLLDALTATTAVPVLLPPLCIEEHCYIDGGLLDNLPLKYCIEQTNSNVENILVVKNNYTSKSIPKIYEDSTAIQYLISLINKITLHINSESKQPIIPNTVSCLLGKYSGTKKWIKQISKEKNRKKLVKKGIKDAQLFLYYKKNLVNSSLE